MKKRLLALLLAGLLTASLAACTTETGREDQSNNGTEAEQTMAPDGPQDPTVAGWTNVDETVYVAVKDGITLTAVDGGAAVKANIGDALRRTRISNTGKSEVEKNGIKYYTDSDKLTADDIVGAKFTACDPTVRYINDKDANVRALAIKTSASIAKPGLNTAVSVIATGMVGEENWSKIELQKDGSTVTCFIRSDLLSADKVTDPDTIDYTGYFTGCTPTAKYLNSDVTLRKNPHKGSTALEWPVKGSTVTVIATGTVSDIEWSRVQYVKKGSEGYPDVTLTGYIQSSFLHKQLNSLEDVLSEYPGFTRLAEAKTMYGTGTYKIRTSPKLDTKDENVKLFIRKPGDALAANEVSSVKVVATGYVNDEVPWCVVEYTDGDGKTHYLFTSMNGLTPESTGAVVVDLNTLVKKYSLTEEKDPVAMKATGKVYCWTEPNTSQEPKTELKSGDPVTVYARGTVNGSKWILFQLDGSDVFYFAGEQSFTAN